MELEVEELEVEELEVEELEVEHISWMFRRSYQLRTLDVPLELVGQHLDRAVQAAQVRGDYVFGSVLSWRGSMIGRGGESNIL